MIKSPLRYPGGKSRAIAQILPLLPECIAEFREPFVGGGSVFLAAKQQLPFWSDQTPRLFWINDLNRDLVCFWKTARDQNEALVKKVSWLRSSFPTGRELYTFLLDERNSSTDFDRAVRFFVMNRITFSGVMDSGGYSQQAYERRFTESAIARLAKLPGLLSGVQITQGDYAELLQKPGKDVFIFLDPPYLSATHSKLYGVKGNLHTAFDHVRFAKAMQRCPHRWLITYDDSPEVRSLFRFATIVEWELQYGMNNYKQAIAAKGKELFIKNY
ncbi:DNA adenine methylase [Leptolyngbya sp. O-77]|uniref:DNA adenine methylase n=1 Tax=Leptolyngbya sp. O-77 TaxID=1080068 RepID=UPI00074D3BFE|nr:DNA adenine methylase [Leptolyngbya sp. O-77]BAU40314.1 Modification methylase DpnIIA [Leptolyngbya sp. O-77]